MGKSDNRLSCLLSDDLLAIAETAMQRERYRSHSELYASFLRHWAIAQQEHALTGPWSVLPAEERDAIDSGLRQLVETGKGKRGSWLKARIYDAIKEQCGDDAKTPTVDQILSRLPDSIRMKLSEPPKS